jgi:hypothetical protein
MLSIDSVNWCGLIARPNTPTVLYLFAIPSDGIHTLSATSCPVTKQILGFEGNRLLIQETNPPLDAFHPFLRYLQSRDHLFPGNPELWLTADAYGWQHPHPSLAYFKPLHRILFPHDVAGQSLRSGGAMHLSSLESRTNVSRLPVACHLMPFKRTFARTLFFCSPSFGADPHSALPPRLRDAFHMSSTPN